MTRLDPRRARDLERITIPLNRLTIILGRHSTTIATNLNAWMPGPASSTLDSGRAPIADDGSQSGPTPRAALGRDIISTAARDFARHLDHAARSAETAARIAATLLAIDPDLAQALVDQAPVDRSGNCANCGTYVANTPADRIRAGRCEPCYRWRKRHAGEDRPRSTWQVEDSGDSGDKSDGLTPQ